MGDARSVMRVLPQDLCAVAGDCGCLGSHADTIADELRKSWSRLDAGWQSYARESVDAYYQQAIGELGRMATVLRQVGQALHDTADLLVSADRAAAALFGDPVLDEDMTALALGSPPDPGFDGVDGAEGAEYGAVVGRPFIAGPGGELAIHPSDVNQGVLGDCYLLAALAALSTTQDGRAVISQMITDNGDGTYTVTLNRPNRRSPSGFEPVDYVVTPEFPLMYGSPVFARAGDVDGQQQEQWVMLIEKAYAQQHGGYRKVHLGYADVALEELTGIRSDRVPLTKLEFDQLADHFEAGDAVTAAALRDKVIGFGNTVIWDVPDASDRHALYQQGVLMAGHEYYVAAVDRGSGTVTIRNPWGWTRGEVSMSFEDFQEAFKRVSVSPIGQQSGGGERWPVQDGLDYGYW